MQVYYIISELYGLARCLKVGKSRTKNKKQTMKILYTLPETNIAPENGWLEYYFPIGEADFQVLC